MKRATYSALAPEAPPTDGFLNEGRSQSLVSKEDVTTVALTFASASLFAAGILALVTGMAKSSWEIVLMAAINLVAWSVYNQMLKQKSKVVRAHLRYMDWMVRPACPRLPRAARRRPHSRAQVTLPLLALKLVNMARSNGTATPSGFFASVYLDLMVALMAFATVAIGYFAVAGFDVTQARLDSILGAFVTCFVGSLGTMATTLGLIYTLAGQTGTTNLPNIIAFSVPWGGYPIVYLFRALQPDVGIEAHVEDVLYAVLDVYSKAIFAFVMIYNMF